MDVLEWTGIEWCNAAFQTSLNTVETMLMNESNWPMMSETFKLCSSLDGNNIMDVRSFLELLIVNLMIVVQQNGR